MSKVVIELQKACLDSSVSCNFLLLKAYYIALKLGIENMTIYCRNELYGYKKDSGNPIPEYRRVGLSFRAKRFGQEKWEPLVLPERTEFETELLCDSVVSMEKISTSSKDVWSKVLAKEDCERINSFLTYKYPIVERLFPTYLFAQILLNVRMVILHWAMDLEKNGILGEKFSFSINEKRKVENVKSISLIIAGDVNNSNIVENAIDSTMLIENESNNNI